MVSPLESKDRFNPTFFNPTNIQPSQVPEVTEATESSNTRNRGSVIGIQDRQSSPVFNLSLTPQAIQKAAELLNEIKTKFGTQAGDIAENLLKVVVDANSFGNILTSLNAPGTPGGGKGGPGTPGTGGGPPSPSAR